MARWYAKLPHGILNDRQVMQLPLNLRWRYIESILLASQQDEGGFLPDTAAISWELRESENTLTHDYNQLAAKGLMEYRSYNPFEDRWFLPAHEEMQKASDAAVRMRELRKRKRKETKEKEKIESIVNSNSNSLYRSRNGDVTSVTEGNESVTKRNDDEAALVAIEAARSILARWSEVTGSYPPDPETKRDAYLSDYFLPVNDLWVRMDRDTTAVCEAMKAKREEMLLQGKTPFRPAAVVGYIIGDLDAQRLNGSNGTVSLDEAERINQMLNSGAL